MLFDGAVGKPCVRAMQMHVEKKPKMSVDSHLDLR